MSQSLVTVLVVVCLAALTLADSSLNAVEPSLDEQAEASPRFGFLALDNSGATVTFNTTSLQYAVLIGIVLVVIALIAIPIIGAGVATFANRGDGYDNNYYYGYDQTQGYSTYSNFAKRSLDVLSPVLAALSEAYRKYENEH